MIPHFLDFLWETIRKYFTPSPRYISYSAKCSGHNCEIIVVDGGSKDLTTRTARQAGATAVISSPKGRACQLNAGAARARGDLFLFLHADSKLPKNWELRVPQAMTPSRHHRRANERRFPPRQWGCFETISIDVSIIFYCLYLPYFSDYKAVHLSFFSYFFRPAQ